MKKNKLAFVLVLSLLLSLLPITGCRVQRRPGPTTPAPTQPAPAPGQQAPAPADRQATRVAEKITRMEEINAATVVIAGTRAWVGVDLKADQAGRLTEAIKNEVTKIVKAEDKNIKTVYVTADADTVTRLRNIARDIEAGRPVSGFMDQLNEIGRRITPTTK